MMSLLRGAHAGHHDVSPSKQQAPEPAVKEIVPSPPASERPDPLTQSQQFSSMKSPIKTESLTVKRRSRPSSGVRTTSGRYVTTYVKEQHSVIRDQCRQKLGAGLSTNVFDTSFVGLLEWIRSERLTRIPHKGGAWDRVLSAAQYFAEQVQSLHLTTQNFTAGTDSAATLVFGQCLLLLELGHENATALRKVFKLFYQFGNELSLLLKQAELFALDVAIQDGVGTAFVDLLNIVTGVAVQFHLAVHGAKESVALDIYASFGGLITAFRAQVAKVAQHMWAASLERAGLIDGPTVDVLRNWLAPQDSVLAFLSSNHVNLANQAADHTCVWFQQHLSSFLRGNDKIMVVEGKQGSGKSTMANWVTDRLQRPIGGRNRKVSTISFAFNQTIRAQSTSLSLVKTLLYQLLEQQIGDLEVYEAIEHAYRELSSSRDAKVHEEKLWTAMTSCLQAINERSDSETLVMVIDGVDEGAGMLKGASAICQRLHSVAQRFASVRLLQFSTPLEMSTPKSSVRLSLTAAQTADDLRMLIRQSLESNTCFRELNEEEQDKMAERLVSAAEGSMLWAGLASHLLRLQKTQSSLMQTCESLQAASKTIPEAVQKLLSAMQLSQDSKSLISWLCAAERPLSFAEIKLLLQASPEKGFMVDRVVDVQGLIRSIRPFVVVGEGLVAIRHVAIERALINMSGNMKALLHLTDRHHDLLARLLIYSKNCTRDEHDVSFTSWSFSLVAQRFHKHQLLEYSVRYWAEHLRSIPSYKANEDLSQFAPAFREIFPSSVTFAILERTCWNSTSFLTDVLGLHLVATRLRQAVFGQTHICVLQSMISYADLCEVLSKSHDSCKYYSLACKLSRTLLGVQSQVTITCSTSLLRISETLVTNSRTEIMTYREETYMLLIECYKHTYGATSVQALEIYKKLAEFYVFIAEETKATEIYKIIQTITVTIYGEHSDEAKSISGHLGVVLRKHEHSHEIEGYEGSFFSGFWEQTTEEFSLTVVERIILIATTHIARGEFAVAEELYAELWLRLTEQCRVTEVLEWHTKKIEVMLIYAEFLMSHKRTTEASSLLLCIWREYEFHAFSAVESIVLQLKEVAVLMKKVSLLTVSLSVFKKCWSFFKSTHKTESSVYREIEEHITVTSKEVVERSSTTQITSTSSETVIREVFESSISSSTTEVSSTTIELCKSLTSVYIKQERYSEAIKCIKSVVKKSWASFFSSTFEATSSSISSSSIDLVVQLAVCYIKQSRFEKAEHIYVQLYRCIRSAYRLDHELVIKYSETLLEFYKSHKMFTKAISFYQELLVEYRSFYGNTHSITIKTLYALGDMCRLHHRTHGYWIEYYLEIITCLNKGATICHHDALRALVAVAECYFEDCRYSESFTYYKLIAATFFKHGVSYECFKQTSEVQMIFEHYERSMIESKVEFSVQLTMLKEYHEACTRHFGAAHSITIAATLQYASICMKSESHQLEAISLYEHISKHSSSTEIITQCKSTLRSLYVKQTTTQSSTTVSKTMIESATTLVYERHLEIRKTHSCSHEASLSCLSQLIQLYYKQSKVEIAVKELRSFAAKCITEITSTKELIAVAISVASIYRSCGYFDHAHTLIKELKMQIIFRSGANVSKWGFNLTSVNRAAFAFLAAFECHILSIEQSITVTELMAEYAVLSLYYERYSTPIKAKSSLAVIFASAAKLRQVLSKRKRIDYYWTIEHEIISYFSSHEARVVEGTGSTAAVKLFVTTLLEYFGEQKATESNFVAITGRAASARIRLLLKEGKFRDSLELCRCTFHYLMCHEGLDDEKETSQGVTLCLMMAGRGYPRCSDPALQKLMMDFSRQIMCQVIDIVKRCQIDLVRCNIEDLNALLGLLGEQQDYDNLQFVLSKLWESRARQKWSQQTVTEIARRLIQVYFRLSQYTSAINLAENILYNSKRVYGSRSAKTLSFYDLLAQLYTTAALQLHNQESKGAKDTSQLYFRKATELHAEVLKLFVNAESSDDEDSDLESEIRSSSSPSTPTQGCGQRFVKQCEEYSETDEIKRHLRLLKLAFQRHGGWSRNSWEFERLTSMVWETHSKELQMDKKNVCASEWSAQGFGQGKAEAREGEFEAPARWEIFL